MLRDESGNHHWQRPGSATSLGIAFACVALAVPAHERGPMRSDSAACETGTVAAVTASHTEDGSTLFPRLHGHGSGP